MSNWRRYINQSIAREISKVTRYSGQTIQFNPARFDQMTIYSSLDAPLKNVAQTLPELAKLTEDHKKYATAPRPIVILLNGTFNHSFDVQEQLMALKAHLSRFDRIAVVAYNPYLSWLYKLASKIGLRSADVPTTFFTETDFANVSKISGFEVCRNKSAVFFPWKLLGFGDLINRILPVIPLMRNLSLTSIIWLRPIIPDVKPRSLSIIIPARNESGNIENALLRMPKLPAGIEIIFVEGNSTDDTWDQIQRIKSKYENQFQIKALKQKGKGKADAVRVGFAEASCELVTILDADLTMPPELLPRFYNAFTEGAGDFINGTRLVYPMEGEAMRFLNLLGNIFFAKALSYVLSVRLGDSLCGTKLLRKVDYERFTSWRADFGDFDPFGDFELLFPAAILAMDIVDIPIRYRERTYGTTNISRFRHGFLLLRMTLLGFFRIKVSNGL